MASVFRSKVDLWLIVVTVAIPVLVLGIVFVGEYGGADGLVAELLAVAICALVMIFCAWLYFSTHYTVTAEALLVKSGPFSWVVPLREVSSIEPTRNPLSSPALSLDRLRVRYGEREIMVSPADKAGFMAAIERQMDAARRQI